MKYHKGTHIGKIEVKLPLSADDMIICLEKSKDSTKTKVYKRSRIHSNTQKSVALLNANNVSEER